jgi:hypothetical protein
MGFAACLGGVIYTIIMLAIAVYSLACAWFVAKKAGYEPWYGILMIVPILNLVLLYFFAFTDWPIEEELKRLKGG